jgi:hypothetical protein
MTKIQMDRIKDAKQITGDSTDNMPSNYLLPSHQSQWRSDEMFDEIAQQAEKRLEEGNIVNVFCSVTYVYIWNCLKLSQ